MSASDYFDIEIHNTDCLEGSLLTDTMTNVVSVRAVTQLRQCLGIPSVNGPYTPHRPQRKKFNSMLNMTDGPFSAKSLLLSRY